MQEEQCKEYWNAIALEAQNPEKAERLRKWTRAARNWLAEYADKRAEDFILDVIGNVADLKKSAKVLDVGCGPGKWTLLFAKKCSSVTAVDISSHMVSLARERARKEEVTNVQFRVMPVSKLTIPDETYDMVNCVTVLQHVLDEIEWKLAVKEMVRVTRVGGRILLYETAPSLVIKKRTPHMRLESMRNYVNEFEKFRANLVYWRAADLSLPLTLFGLREYAASFNERVYYFSHDKPTQFLPNLLSLLSKMAVLLAEPIDYRLARTPLGFLSFGRIMLFEKNDTH